VLDDESFEAFSAAVTNPDEPNEALRAPSRSSAAVAVRWP
jgi:uncharacterized protein (DUF1778 family)